jgi:glutathione S-transferase
MGFEYVSVEEAIARDGLRMVVVGGVPSSWGEAAKGILHIKRIDWVAVRLAYDSEPLKAWAGQRSGPVAMFDNDPPRSTWSEILLLAERLAPEPPLLPPDLEHRALALEVSQEICGEGGLNWTRRLQLVHSGLNGEGGFHPRVAAYLGKKYGHSAETGAAAQARVVQLLEKYSAILKAQRSAGSPYFIGDKVTAVDVYLATAMGVFAPLPQEQGAIDPATRAAFETLDSATAAALDPILLAHRDMMYAKHLQLPLSL